MLQRATSKLICGKPGSRRWKSKICRKTNQLLKTNTKGHVFPPRLDRNPVLTASEPLCPPMAPYLASSSLSLAIGIQLLMTVTVWLCLKASAPDLPWQSPGRGAACANMPIPNLHKRRTQFPLIEQTVRQKAIFYPTAVSCDSFLFSISFLCILK